MSELTSEHDYRTTFLAWLTACLFLVATSVDTAFHDTLKIVIATVAIKLSIGTFSFGRPFFETVILG